MYLTEINYVSKTVYWLGRAIHADKDVAKYDRILTLPMPASDRAAWRKLRANAMARGRYARKMQWKSGLH